MCVQALLSHRISPAVVQVEGGRVERLKDWIPRIKDLKAKQEKRLSSSDPGLVDDDGPTLSSIEVPTTPSSQGSMELDDDDVNMASGDEGNNDDVDADDDEAASGQVVRHALVGGVIKPTPKMPWTEEDIRFLIELRAMGMTHMQTAVRFFPTPNNNCCPLRLPKYAGVCYICFVFADAKRVLRTISTVDKVLSRTNTAAWSTTERGNRT